MGFPIPIPEFFEKKAEALKILPEDIVETFVRGSGKGGQKINKTSSMVVLRHQPTGVEVRCQKHREQSKNRLSAYKLLINKIEFLFLGKQSAQAQKIFKLKKQKQRRTRRSKEKILEAKRRRSEIKENRQIF